MDNKLKKRILRKWAFIWPVNKSLSDSTTYWVFCSWYYEYQEYEYWNDWQEGVGNNWKWSWNCKKQYKNL